MSRVTPSLYVPRTARLCVSPGPLRTMSPDTMRIDCRLPGCTLRVTVFDPAMVPVAEAPKAWIGKGPTASVGISRSNSKGAASSVADVPRPTSRTRVELVWTTTCTDAPGATTVPVAGATITGTGPGGSLVDFFRPHEAQHRTAAETAAITSRRDRR